MGALFTRTVSQALQAFLPAAAALAAYRREGQRDTVTGLTWGVVAALVVSAPAGWIFQRSIHQSIWEVVLAVLSLGCVVWLLRRACRRSPVAAVPAAAITVLLVTRQSMEIAAVSMAAIELRSLDPLTAIAGAAALAAVAAIAWAWAAGCLAAPTARVATWWFIGLFLAQLGMYAFHEAAEARLLPWSEPIHAATEPYGPDGIYGRYFSWLLLAVPLAAAALAGLRARWTPPTIVRSAGRARHFASAGIALLALGDGVSLRSADIPPSAPVQAIASLADADHILFRHTGVDNSYNTLSLAPLAQPSSHRLSTGIPCERVSFGGQRGICLQATRRVLTTYRALLFDREFKTIGTWALTGGPSRTRIAPDGRVGAITVFVIGHGYGSSFSTKTTLVDMASGDPLGDLEEFTTWRDGARIKAQDFNFWGVTFGRDSNTFYATLGTQGKTYLVKGDLALRKLTVLRGGVECPSLSPDGQHIAFKKRTSEAVAKWRVAVLDLATMTDRVVANELRNIDDQIEWLDDHRVLYAVPRTDSAVTDVWVADTGTNVAPQVFIPSAESPIVVHTAR